MQLYQESKVFKNSFFVHQVASILYVIHIICKGGVLLLYVNNRLIFDNKIMQMTKD